MPPTARPAADDLFEVFFALSHAGGLLGTPLLTETGALTDVAQLRLNPAAAELLQQPTRPAGTLRQVLAPEPADAAAFAAWLAAAAGPAPQPLEAWFRVGQQRQRLQLAAQPAGAHLLISLQAAPAPEPVATATDQANLLLQALLAQAPVAISLFQGPELRITTANEQMATLWGYPPGQVLNRPLLEAVPELQGQGFDDLLRQVLYTGQPILGTETPAQLRRNGQVQTAYFNFVYQPLYDARGQILGVIDVAVDVTEQVQTRRQLEQLNQELESRVQERTRQLEQQQQRLSRILGQVPAAIATLSGPEHRFTFANDLYQHLVGQRATLGLSVAEALPEVVDQGFVDLLNQVRSSGQPFIGQEIPVQLHTEATAGLQQRYLNFTYQPLREAGEGPSDILVFAVDVTEQVQTRQQLERLNQELETRVEIRTREAQEALREAERQRGELWRVFEQTPLAIAVYRGPRYIIELANPTVARLWGRTQEQLIGKGLFEALPEVAGMGYEELLDGVMSTGQPFEAHAMEAQHERNGRLETVYWDFVYVPMYEADGSIYGAMVVATEVTGQVLARREVEQLNRELETRVHERTRQLEEQQELLRQILRQVPAAIATLSGPEHRYTFFNEPYQRLTAGRATLGRSVAEVVPEVAAQGFLRHLDRVYATGQPFIGQAAPLALTDTTTGQPHPRYIDLVYQPLFDDQNQPRGILAFILDVTDRVQASQQVQHLNEELAATNQALQTTNQELHATNARLIRTNADLDTFVYTASHDLKAPISNIEGLLDALRDYLPDSGPDSMVPHLLTMMQGAVTRFQQTVGHLTNVSRLQYGQSQPAEAVELATLVKDVWLDLAPLVEASQARLTTDLAALPVVHFSPKDLRSILFNLLSNALKYRSPERPPQVLVTSAATGTEVLLTVADNGLGLSEQQQTKLFMLFRRLHNHVEGSGVGLFMIKRIIENAGGTITVHSQPGVGSTFHVALPRL